MSTPVWPPSVVDRRQLRVGPLVAEGGEGRVYRLDDEPGTLYKEYREPQPIEPLQALIDWSEQLGEAHPVEQARLRSSSAWPQAVVAGSNAGSPDLPAASAGGGLAGGGLAAGSPAGLAAGLLMPEAPAHFSVQHRRGRAYLANLSYLTADPVQRSAAYGVALPAPGSALRVGLLYALARLLSVLTSSDVPAGHGDLSQKNLLWSLERGPEVFLLDCDNAALGAPADGRLAVPADGRPASPAGGHVPGLAGGGCVAGRRRVMTPNWEDPAIEPGDNPTLASDRYSLALIFLRVVGAAHYPLQACQRQQRSLRVEFEVPEAWDGLPEAEPDASLWTVCARSLSRADPNGRPGPDEWCSVLVALLDHLGAGDLVETVDRLQDGDAAASSNGQFEDSGPSLGDPARVGALKAPTDAGPTSARPAGARPDTGAGPAVGARPDTGAGPDVGARPDVGVAALDVQVLPVPARYHPVSWRLMGVVAEDGAIGPLGPAPVPLRPGQFLREGLAYWWAQHQRAGRLVIRKARTGAGLRRLALLCFLDLVMAGMLLFLVGMLVSPFLGL